MIRTPQVQPRSASPAGEALRSAMEAPAVPAGAQAVQPAGEQQPAGAEAAQPAGEQVTRTGRPLQAPDTAERMAPPLDSPESREMNGRLPQAESSRHPEWALDGLPPLAKTGRESP